MQRSAIALDPATWSVFLTKFFLPGQE